MTLCAVVSLGHAFLNFIFCLFRYATAHWLQKSAESFYGSVLCCPGAFSVFRLETLVDVADAYAVVSKTGGDVYKYDQGEDRML